MNEVKEVFRNKVFQKVIAVLLIFVVGLIAGYEMHKNGISYLQGYSYNLGDVYESASESNASSSNASNSNASSSNASSSNASSSNASSSNVEWLPEVSLISFKLDKSSVKPGDTLTADIDYEGFWENALILFKNKSTRITFSTSILSNNRKFKVPSNLMDGTYEVTQILFIGSRTQYRKYTKLYSKTDTVNSVYFNFKTTLEVKTPVTPSNDNNGGNDNTNDTPKTQEIVPIKITSFKLEKNKVTSDEQVYITYETNKAVNNIKLEFTSSSKEKMTVYVHSLKDKPYFDIPTTAKVGKYTLTSAVFTADDITTAFSNTKNVKDHTYYDFKTTLEITEPKKPVEEKIYNYNNEDMNAKLISELYDAPDNSSVTINAHNSPIVNKDVFGAIKGTNKQLVIDYNDNQFIFNGKDITDTSKYIDASVNVGKTNEDDDIKELVKDSIVIYFGDNGKLPGKAKVRIKVTDELRQLIDGKTAYLYCYNDESKNFTYIETDVKETSDGYYEFEVNHNSKYILVNSRLSSSLLAKESSTGNTISDVTRFLKDNTVYLILIIVAVLIIILVAVFLLIQKKNKKKELQP